MNLEDIQALRDIFARCHIVLSFNGPFSQSVIEELGEAIRRHLETQTQPQKRIVDVFSVYIEVTQNIRHYAEANGTDPADTARLNAGTVLIAREGDDYAVVSSNLVRKEHVAALSQRVENIIALDQAALKAAYKERLRAPVEDGATGAGLGLMQLARKASRPLEYNFTEIDDRHSYFSLTVYI